MRACIYVSLIIRHSPDELIHVAEVEKCPQLMSCIFPHYCRYLHRGNFPWDKVENKDPVAMKIFDALRHMEDIRAYKYNRLSVLSHHRCTEPGFRSVPAGIHEA